MRKNLVAFYLSVLIFTSCNKNNNGNNNSADNLPTITTVPISNVTANSATSGGKITSDGSSSVTQRGVCWATSQNPTIADNKLSAVTTDGNFVVTLTGLASNTTYYVKAYAVNSSGTAYGSQVSFKTLSGIGNTGSQFNPNLTYGSVRDNNGNIYKTIKIGSQTWMAENLRTTQFRNGAPISNIKDSVAWKNSKQGAWCYYNNDSGNDTLYGKLYNWYAVISPDQLCPAGWHVPTDAEWNVLAKQVDPSADTTLCCNNAAGGSMKSTGTQYWESPNRNATNSSGFSGLPGGSRSLTSTSFTFVGQTGYWWSSTESIIKTGEARFLFYFDGTLTSFNGDKSNGFSVRCLKD